MTASVVVPTGLESTHHMVRFRDCDPGEEIVALEYLQMTRYQLADGLAYQIQLVHVGFSGPKSLAWHQEDHYRIFSDAISFSVSFDVIFVVAFSARCTALTSHKLGSDASDRPHVNTGSILSVSHKKLRSAVPSSCDVVCIVLARAESSSETEVAQFHDALFGEEYIFRFDVSMNSLFPKEVQFKRHDSVSLVRICADCDDP